MYIPPFLIHSPPTPAILYQTSHLSYFYRAIANRLYQRGPIHLTPEELSLYNGTDKSLPIYLAINGTIYDVSASPSFYGPGGSYHFFAGREGTRAFVTGCFEEDLTPDMRGVEEMFIPVYEDDGDGNENKAELKKRREQVCLI